MIRHSKQRPPGDAPPETLRPYYKRLRTIASIALVVSGIWCLTPFWRQLFISEKCPGIYWLFVTEGSSVLFWSLILLLGGIGLSCFSRWFRAPYLGLAIGLALVFRFGVAYFLGDFVVMENTSSFSTEKHVYHLSYYYIMGFSDGYPYGLIECDVHDVVCKQIERIVVRSYDRQDPTLRYDDVTHMLHVEGDGQTYYSYELEE